MPVKRRDDYSFPHKHYVVDVSKVALNEMKHVHDKASPQHAASKNSIEYSRGNLLQSTLPLESNSFQAWIDKGLVNALFKDSGTRSSDQSKLLFDEAYRLLVSSDGIVFVVTMADDHSLRLLIENWCRKDVGRRWKPSLHVWEMVPVTGSMRPFGFVMRKASENDDTPTDCSIVFHSLDGPTSLLSLDSDDVEEAYEKLRTQLITPSREAFKQATLGSTPSKDSHLFWVTLEIKPYDTGNDLHFLGEAVITTATNYTTCDDSQQEIALQPKWQPWRDANGNDEGILRIVPIGYGISKLLLQCIIDSEDIDDLREAILEWGEAHEGSIQSVDINWDKTFPVAYSSQLLSSIISDV